ncbi:MAG: hypothetical protein KDI62_10490, partial [Anaerolineae bacterium]|nr:hypothetical protein [Anaerolineae bacterium]
MFGSWYEWLGGGTNDFLTVQIVRQLVRMIFRRYERFFSGTDRSALGTNDSAVVRTVRWQYKH